MPMIPFPMISKSSALAYYYPPLFARDEPLFDLCALPMLAGSLDEAETLLRVARPYCDAALARLLTEYRQAVGRT